MERWWDWGRGRLSSRVLGHSHTLPLLERMRGQSVGGGGVSPAESWAFFLLELWVAFSTHHPDALGSLSFGAGLLLSHFSSVLSHAFFSNLKTKKEEGRDGSFATIAKAEPVQSQ